ncbi:MAG: FAD-dependent oxidoreductase [Kiritimatiellae bacterium]|nr:FAD-dependent oxidoreductase [Kiritimatiellia bacterium]MDD5520861.1 FAD-dependent oxidoreductase [Kiritimatiellia bacterium]
MNRREFLTLSSITAAFTAATGAQEKTSGKAGKVDDDTAVSYITETEKKIRLVGDYDVCVLGGSCTGVFAAVRAAQSGARVALVEKQNAFGGVATSGLVNVWHSLQDTEGKQTIIGGLTKEIIDRLQNIGAATGKSHYILNTEELKIELDKLVMEHHVTPFLHTFYAAACMEGSRVKAVFIENKDGRQAIRAKVFVDATGDGDLARDAGIPFNIRDGLQPPTTCAKISSLPKGFAGLVAKYRNEFGLVEDRGWGGPIPGAPNGMQMCAYTHVFNTVASDARQLTAAEIEGRRQIRATMDIARKYGGDENKPFLGSLASYIGIRETRSFKANYVLTEKDVLYGKRFPDAIANGSYHVDVHDPVKGGFIFKNLNGTTVTVAPGGTTNGRWREATTENPTFYQIPFSTMVNGRVDNVIMAGRMISTDRGAFGGIRVMVNLNQVGEAAGVAAALSVSENKTVSNIDIQNLRGQLSKLGAVII